MRCDAGMRCGVRGCGAELASLLPGGRGCGAIPEAADCSLRRDPRNPARELFWPLAPGPQPGRARRLLCVWAPLPRGGAGLPRLAQPPGGGSGQGGDAGRCWRGALGLQALKGSAIWFHSSCRRLQREKRNALGGVGERPCGAERSRLDRRLLSQLVPASSFPLCHLPQRQSRTAPRVSAGQRGEGGSSCRLGFCSVLRPPRLNFPHAQSATNDLQALSRSGCVNAMCCLLAQPRPACATLEHT